MTLYMARNKKTGDYASFGGQFLICNIKELFEYLMRKNNEGWTLYGNLPFIIDEWEIIEWQGFVVKRWQQNESIHA